MQKYKVEVTAKAEEESQIAANWLRHIQHVLNQHDPLLFSSALYKAGISSGDFQEKRNIRLSQLDIVQRFARQYVPDLTVQLYKMTDLLDLGLMGYAILSSGTIKKALEITLRYHTLTSDRYEISMETEGNDIIMRPIPNLRNLDDVQDIIEDNFVGMWHLLSQILGDSVDYHKASAHFNYPAPDYVHVYQEVIPCPCYFNSEQAQIRFPKHWLELPVVTANIATAGVCASMCERLLGHGNTSSTTLESVQRLLLSRPGKRMLRLEEAAEELRLSVSQLRKRLYSAGTSYKQVVLNVRMALARHYLEVSSLSIQEIAYLLDYTQPAPFSRAFKSYYGMPPQECRHNIQL